MTPTNSPRIIIEPTRTGYSAYSPDVPGCIATGSTCEEVVRTLLKAIEFHLEGLGASSSRTDS
jgi:predicted RNase H-like HicB family nuclease